MRWFIIFSLCLLLAGQNVLARSAYSPRHTGMEPPGGPRRVDIGGRSLSRTPGGGMGYTDAYGNTLDDQFVEKEKPVRKRMPEKRPEPVRPLPDPMNSRPVWSFN